MSKWRNTAAIEQLKKTVEFIHLRRWNPIETSQKELFGTVATIPFIRNGGEVGYLVGLSTRFTDRMPSKKIGRDTAFGRALRTGAEEIGFIPKSASRDETGNYLIVRGFMNEAQFQLFRSLCDQAPDQAAVNFNTALQAPALLEAA